MADTLQPMSDDDSAAIACTGQCLCGRIRLVISRLNRNVVYCHCTQCRRQSGHYYAATDVLDEHLQVDGDEHLTWYAASDDARRGFCRHCGSALFWKSNGSAKTSVLAGCLDAPDALTAVAHIFTDDKGSYYDITDGLPCHPGAD